LGVEERLLGRNANCVRRSAPRYYARTMRIDAVMDFVCPWCFIGHTRLVQALGERPDVSATVVPRPYLLDPAVPDAGYDLRERLRQRYGADPERMFERVEEAARASGIALDFSGITRYPSTLRAHALVALAGESERATEAATALFDAYFMRGEDIGNVEVLASVAKRIGLSASETMARLADAEALHAVRKEADAMRRRGIEGVPWFSLEERAFIRGAESVAAMVAAIDRARA
jgi:predicted DsbA family dithiol-disulfide isomerase